MNYQDMLNLKKGDLIIVDGVHGEVNGKGSSCGSPGIWLKRTDENGDAYDKLVSVGYWKEHAWYKFGYHRRVKWQNEFTEELSMQNAKFVK